MTILVGQGRDLQIVFFKVVGYTRGCVFNTRGMITSYIYGILITSFYGRVMSCQNNVRRGATICFISRATFFNVSSGLFFNDLGEVNYRVSLCNSTRGVVN